MDASRGDSGGVTRDASAQGHRDRSRDFVALVIAFILGGGGLYLSLLLLTVPGQWERAIAVATLLTLSIGAWWLLARGKVEATIRLLAFSVWTYVSVTSFFLGGVEGTSVIIYVPIIVLVGWLIGARAAVVVTVASVATTLGFVVAASRGWLPPTPATPPAMRWVIQAGVFVLSAVLIVSTIRAHREHLASVQRLGAELAQRTADLDRAQAVARVGSWVYDLGADTIYLSAETCRIFGLPEGTKSSRDAYLSRVHPDDRDAVDGAWRIAIEGGAPFDHEHRILIGDAVRWIRQIAHMERSADGTPVRGVGTTQDITDRRHAEAALREKDVHLEAVLASTADGILAVDAEGHVIQANRRFAELWGIPPALLDRKDERAMLDHVVGQLRDPAGFLDRVASLYRSDAEFEDTVEFSDGRIFERSTAPLILNGANVGRVWSFRDVTARTRSAIALDESRNLLQTIVDTAPVRVFWKDRDLRYLGCNPAFARDGGAEDPADVIGKDDYQLGWAAQADVYRADDRAVIDSGVAKLSYEEQQTTPDGGLIWLRTSKVPLRSHDGEVIGVLGIYEDFTERKRVEQRLSLAIEATRLVMWEADIVNDRLTLDLTMLPLLGFAAEGTPDSVSAWLEWVHPDDRVAFRAAVALAARASDPVFDVEYRMAGPDGVHAWIQTRGRVTERDADHRPLRAVGTSMNVTERKQIQEAIRASEERSRGLASMLRRMCDNVPDMIWAKDLDKRYLFANKAMCEQLLAATDTEEPVGRTDVYFAERERARHPENPEWHTYGELCQDTDAVTLERGTTCVFEESGNVKGVPLVLDVHKSPFHGEEGAVIGTVGSARDITTRRRADEALRESQGRLAAVYNASPIGITITRQSDGTVLDANEAALRLYGCSRAEGVGRTVLDLGVYDDPSQRHDILERLRREGSVDRCPVRLHGRNPDVSEVELSVRPITLKGEQCLVAMMLDVTDRRRLELAHLQAQKLASLGTLAGGIAHDFNNILSAIRGNAELAAAEVGPDHAAAESLAEVAKASMRASELVRRIMAFGRPTETSHVAVDLAVVVVEVLKLLRSTLPAGIALRTVFTAPAPYVLADAGQIHEAIVNLTANAAYAIGSRPGSIEYRLETIQVDDKLARRVPGLSPGRHARLSVIDDGCGMGPELLERVFDAFYTTKAVGEGTGLGLSMVHGIMRSHNGAVTVESAPGAGAAFALYFPAVDPQVDGADAVVPAADPTGAGRRVLFVDDERALVSLATRVLVRLGHQVTNFTDPRAAVSAFVASPDAYDVVVTDLSMPHMSGFDVARAVLALRPTLPVLMTTGYVTPEDEATAHGLGIRALVLKPFSVDYLSRLVDQPPGGAPG